MANRKISCGFCLLFAIRYCRLQLYSLNNRRRPHPRADAQTAIWLLSLGDRAGAAEHARKALGETGPGTAGLAALVAFLAQPEVAPPPSQSPLREYARAYALL